MAKLYKQVAVDGSDDPVQLYAEHVDVDYGVSLKALHANGGVVYVGFDEDVTTASGYPLAAGEEFPVPVDNKQDKFRPDDADPSGDFLLTDVWLVGDTADDKVAVVGR